MDLTPSGLRVCGVRVCVSLCLSLSPTGTAWERNVQNHADVVS